MRASNSQMRLGSASTSAMTLPEVVVSAAILGMVSAALLVGISTLQRTFRASEHHAKSQIEQARILDYVARDIRRCTSMTRDTYNGFQRLKLTIPDYYQSGAKTSYTIDDVPRDPVRSTKAGRIIDYGTSEVAINYYRNGSTICRSVNGTEVPIVSDVEDFKLEFPGNDTREVEIQVKFRPRYSFRTGNAAAENGTLVKTKVLLRNLR